jgi:hypothetical protein
VQAAAGEDGEKVAYKKAHEGQQLSMYYNDEVRGDGHRCQWGATNWEGALV